MQDLRPGLDHLAQGGAAFRHPGAVVQQPGDRQERCDIDRFGAQHTRGVGGQRGGLRIAQPGHLADRDARRGRGRAAAQMRERRAAGIRVGRIVAGDHPLRRQCRVHRAGEHRDRIDRAAGRHHAARRDAADRRLQPDDVAERRRHPPRPGGVGAQREAARSPPRPRPPSPTTSRPAPAPHRTRCAACRTGCACRPARWRTDRGWSCRAAPPRPPAGAAPRARWPRRYGCSRGRRRWSAGRRRRCCPSPRTARPTAAGPAVPPPPARVRAPAPPHPAGG